MGEQLSIPYSGSPFKLDVNVRSYAPVRSPYRSGKSHHGAQEHNIRTMPLTLMILRCSTHERPARRVADSRSNKGLMMAHASSGRS